MKTAALVLAFAIVCFQTAFALGAEPTRPISGLDRCVGEVFIEGTTPDDAMPQCSMAVLLGSYIRSQGSDHRLLARIDASPADATAFWEINERLLANPTMDRQWFASHSASPVEMALQLMFADLGEADALQAFAILAADADGWYADYVADMAFDLFCRQPAFFADHLNLFEKHIPWIGTRMQSLSSKERLVLEKSYSNVDSPGAMTIRQWLNKK